VGETIRLLWRHLALFAPLAVVSVALPLLLVHLVWGEESADWGIATGSAAGVAGSVLLGWFVAPALCVAFFMVALDRIADGERPTVGEVLRAAVPRLPAALGTVVLQMLAIVVGLAALVVPGVYATTLLWLGPQAAVSENRAPVDALKRSARLVKGRWWETSGRLLLALVVAFVALMPFWVLFGFVDYGGVYVVVDVLTQTLLLSFVELFAALLFLVLRR